MNRIDDLHNPTTQDPAMRTAHLTASTSAAAIAAAFPRGPRIAFAPETGAGAGADWTPNYVNKGGVAGPGAAKREPAKKDAVPKADADEAAPESDNMSKLMALMQTIVEQQAATNTRMDAMEAKAKEGAAKTPDDLTEAEKEEAAKADGIEGEMDAIRARMPLSTRLAAEKAKEDAVVRAQVRADSAFALHGKRAPMPLAGETPVAYRVRVLRQHQQFSEAFKGVDLGAIAASGEANFSPIEDRIYADSAEASKRPEGPADGGFTVRTKVDPHSGQRTNEFFGRSTFVKHLTPPTRHVRSFNTTGQPLQHVFSA